MKLFESYLSGIEKVEGLSIEEFMAKARNAEKEFAVQPGDDENAQHAKQHQGIVYNESRFEMQALN